MSEPMPQSQSDEAVETKAPANNHATAPVKVSLRKNVMWTGLGNVVYLGCQYLVLTILAKLGSPELVGRYSLALAITAPPIIFSQMQLRKMQVTDVRGEFRFADYFTSRLVSTLLALLVIAGIAVAGHYSTQMRSLILLVAATKAFESLSDIAYGGMQKHEQMRKIAISMTIKGVGSVAAFGVLFGVFHDLILAVVGMGAAWALLFAAYDLPNARRFASSRGPVMRPKRAVLWKIWVIAVPLAIGSGLTSLGGSVPRYIVERLCDERTLGFFSVAAAPLILVTLLCSAITEASMARIAGYYQDGKMKAFYSLAVRITALQVAGGLLLAGVFALFGRQLLSILFTPEYAPSAYAALVMLIGVAISSFSAFGSLTLNSARSFTTQTIVTAIVFAIQIPIAYALTARWGLLGASWALAIRYLVWMVAENGAAVLVLGRRRYSASAQSLIPNREHGLEG